VARFFVYTAELAKITAFSGGRTMPVYDDIGRGYDTTRKSAPYIARRLASLQEGRDLN